MYHQVSRLLVRPRTVSNVKQAMMRHALIQNSPANFSLAMIQQHMILQFRHGLCTRPQSEYNKILMDFNDTRRSCIGALKQTVRSISSNPIIPQHPVSQTTVGIQKLVLPLSAKRPSKKKKPTIADQKDLKQIVAYATAEEFHLEKLESALKDQGLYSVMELPSDAEDALYVKAKYKVAEQPREIFFFREGSVIFWNVHETERKEVLRFVRKHSDNPYQFDLILQENEVLDFQHSSSSSSLIGSTVNLKLVEEPEPTEVLDKYAFSNAISLSVKLAIWESSLENFVSSIEHVTEDLRDGKKIRMSKRNVLQKTGELFSLRHLINLSSDLLDTPDFYWDRDSLETLYQSMCNYLNISRRTRVMNEKLNHCCELTELLSSHLNDSHHVRLEWMIILLIMVEVCFEIIHYIDKYSSKDEESRNSDEKLESSS